MSSQAKPETIRGGCLCEAIRYEVKFPPDHDFLASCSTCQCTQCRKNTGVLLFRQHTVPLSSVVFTPPLDAELSETKLRRYYASEHRSRGFCGECGSFLFWFNESTPRINLLVGSIDQADLEAYGEILTTAREHLWCEREIKGVTDHLQGQKWKLDNEGDGAELMDGKA